MEKVDNKEIIRKIGLRSMKQNKISNRIVILAIFLMTFMFISVFSIGFSLSKNIKTMQIRQSGNIASISLDQPDKQQIEEIKKCSALYHVGVSLPAEVARPVSSDDLKIRLIYHDDENFKYNVSPALENIKGTYPQKENEIMMSESGLKAIGIKSPEIGESVLLKINGTTENFILSGYFIDYGFRVNDYDAFISEKFAEKCGKTVEKDGTAYISAKKYMGNKLQNQIDNTLTVREGQGLFFNSTDDHTTIITAAVVLFICLIIVLSGYLLIYNIMYISVNKNIRFYGMLKTIGTTSKQIKKIVKIQAFRMALCGIPLGIAAGFVLSFFIVPFAGKIFEFDNSVLPSKVTFNPIIFIGTIFFALLTIFISCRKPAKFAGNISPVEAMKYNGTVSGKIKSHKADDGGKIYKMAFRNISRNKKRTSIVLISLTLGIIALLTTQTFLNCLDLENYSKSYFPFDFSVSTNVSDDDNFEITDSEKADDSYKLAENIKNIPNTDTFITISGNIDAVYNRDSYMPFFKDYAKSYNYSSEDEIADLFEKGNDSGESPDFTISVAGIDRKTAENFNIKSKKKIDIDKFENGEECLIGTMSDASLSKEMIGKTIELKNIKTGKTQKIKVGICLTTKDDIGSLNYDSGWTVMGLPDIILVSDKFIDELADEKWVSKISVKCDSKDEAAVSSEIKNLALNSKCVPSKSHIESKSETIKSFKSAIFSMKVLTIGISFVLLLIGIVNFINVMLVGLITRKNEFAVMESIGMTKRQVYKLLAYEGIYYGGFVVLLILTVGNAVIFAIGNLSTKLADYAIFNYPYLIVSLVIVLILIICVSVPIAAYKYVSEKSIVERLREDN